MDRLPAPPLPAWIEEHYPYTRYCLKLGDHRVHLVDHGEGRPLLMLHGNPTWGFLWRKVIEELRGEPFRFVVPDLVGLGLSDKPRDSSVHSLAFHARTVGELVDRLDLKGLIFLGQDWGGSIGLRALADRPERLAGTVLLNTAVTPPREGFRPTAFHRFAQAPGISDLGFRVLGFPLRSLHRVQGDDGSIRGPVARAYRWPLRRFSDRVAPLALARMVPDSLDHPSVPELRVCEEFLQDWEGAARIVWGEADPILGRLRRRLERLLPQAPVRSTPGGHFLQEEQASAISEAVREVTAELDGKAG